MVGCGRAAVEKIAAAVDVRQVTTVQVVGCGGTSVRAANLATA